MELSLKAYLRGKEYSLEVLKASARKNGFGHDLSKLLDESRRRKVGREVKLNRNDMWVIRFVDDMYKHKEFEYGYVGTRQMPKLELVEAVARKLVSGLKDYCYRKSGLKHETSTVPPAKDAFLAVTAEQSCLPISREENQ